MSTKTTYSIRVSRSLWCVHIHMSVCPSKKGVLDLWMSMAQYRDYLHYILKTQAQLHGTIIQDRHSANKNMRISLRILALIWEMINHMMHSHICLHIDKNRYVHLYFCKNSNWVFVESLVQTKTKVKQDMFPMMEEVANVRKKFKQYYAYLILYFSLPFYD